MKKWQLCVTTLLAISLTLGLGSLDGRAAKGSTTYIANLAPLNSNITGHKVHGHVRFTVSGNTLTIRLDATGLPPGMMHMVHLHGFPSGKAAACPGVDADTNHDGIIDLKETEPAAGVTMVPLDGGPAALNIASNTYPVASKDGRISYRKSISLVRLNRSIAAKFQGASLDLDKRVVFIHGVPDNLLLPETVASLPGVPAQATLPIACGKIVPTR